MVIGQWDFSGYLALKQEGGEGGVGHSASLCSILDKYPPPFLVGPFLKEHGQWDLSDYLVLKEEGGEGGVVPDGGQVEGGPAVRVAGLRVHTGGQEVGHHLLLLLPGGHQQHRAQLLTHPSQACTSVQSIKFRPITSIYCTILQCTPMGEKRVFDYSTVAQFNDPDLYQ
jgi:hypothetical protein